MSILTILALLFVAFQTGVADQTSVTSEIDTSPSQHAFLDLNGDGIDDNYLDLDRDGIPDKYVSESKIDISSSSGIFGGRNTGRFTLAASEANSYLFGNRLSRTRCLSLNRGGFGADADFGPGNGIGLGAVKGVTCVGGICF